MYDQRKYLNLLCTYAYYFRSNLAIHNLQLLIVGYHQNSTDETLYDVRASGELVFEGIDAYAEIHIAKENSNQNEAQIFILTLFSILYNTV